MVEDLVPEEEDSALEAVTALEAEAQAPEVVVEAAMALEEVLEEALEEDMALEEVLEEVLEEDMALVAAPGEALALEEDMVLEGALEEALEGAIALGVAALKGVVLGPTGQVKFTFPAHTLLDKDGVLPLTLPLQNVEACLCTSN